MPIKIKNGLPAISKLKAENIFVMTESMATRQDIRPLKIAIVNLMPEKEKTELHLLRRLSNTPIQLEVDLVHTETHLSKTTSKEHLDTFYTTFSKIRSEKYDGLIITGAPVEKLDFNEVNYWEELKEIMEWSKHNVNSVLYLCWAAQAGLYYHFGINKYSIDKKQFGIFEHRICEKRCPLIRGFDDFFYAPHSRHTTIKKEDIQACEDLRIISKSDEVGMYIMISNDGKHVFVTGHSEYDPMTLNQEYWRDKKKGFDVDIPKNYFPDNNPHSRPIVNWRSHSNLLFSNWVNYYVYQTTPFNKDDIV